MADEHDAAQRPSVTPSHLVSRDACRAAGFVTVDPPSILPQPYRQAQNQGNRKV